MSQQQKTLQHYWLIAGQAHFVADGAFHTRNLNALSVTPKKFLNQTELAKSQQTIQARLVRQTFPDGNLPADFKFVDVFVMSVSWMGQMTEAEFLQGHDELVAEQMAARSTQQATSKLAN